MKKIVFIVSMIIVSANVLQAQVITSDSLALVSIYNATNGAGWTRSDNWLSGPVTTWFGVSVSNKRVVRLELCTSCVSSGGNNLQGTIPTDIGQLTALTHLVMSGNNLAGGIPAEIGNLTNLFWLDLAVNKLTGGIPTSIKNLGSLSTLLLAANELSGTLPKEIGDLASLTNLSVNGNKLSGSLPPEIGNLSLLIQLQASHNLFSGSIPKEIGNLTNMLFVSLENNQLTGSIPKEIGNLTKMYALYLQSNNLSGIIPAEIGNLTKLTTLYLNNNQLTGPIPHEIGNLGLLQIFIAHNNQLTDSIPDEIGNLVKLNLLSMYNNQLSGNIPASIGNLTKLTNLALSDNQLTGAIPATVGTLTLLDSFDVSNNKLTGSIPASLANLAVARYIVLYRNQLTGALPASFSNLPALQYLDLEDNQLTDLPDLSANTSLWYLSLGKNSFTFEDLEPNVGITGISYTPQNVSLKNEDQSLNEGDTFTTSFTIGGAFNEYRWWKEGMSVSGATGSTLTIPSVSVGDAGSYQLVVTNTKVAGLFFTAEAVALSVTPKAVVVVKTPVLLITQAQQVLSDNPVVTFPSTSTSASVSKQLDLSNTGDAPLVVQSITTNGDFATGEAGPFTILPSEHYSLAVEFDPAVEGHQSGLLTITSNADSLPRVIELTGIGFLEKRTYIVTVDEVEVLSGTPVDFDKTEVGDQREKVISLVNTGNSTMQVEDIQVTGRFILNTDVNHIVEPGETLQINVVFDPDHIGLHEGKITIVTNGDIPVAIFELSGEGEADIEVFNAVTTRANGKNDFLTIRNINLFPGNRVQVFDRWGNTVYSASDYDNDANTFRGVNQHGNILPEGTYFYIVDKRNGSDPVTGFLMIRN